MMRSPSAVPLTRTSDAPPPPPPSEVADDHEPPLPPPFHPPVPSLPEPPGLMVSVSVLATGSVAVTLAPAPPAFDP